MDIGEIKKTGVVVTKVRLTEFKGRNFLDIRDFFKPKNAVDYAPTKKGIALDVSKVAELISLIEQAEAKIVVDKKQ
jgi:hypothetical protein